MFDLWWTELSFGISFLFNIFLFLFIVLYYRKYVVAPKWEKKNGDIGLILLALILIIFTTPLNSDDFFHYQEKVWKYSPNSSGWTLEPIYDFIIILVNKNYFAFRLFVWGGAFLFTVNAFKRFGVNKNVAIFFLVAVYLMKFNYARSTLAMSSYFLGLSFLLRPLPKKRIISVIFSFLFFIGAYSFHHSILPVIAFTTVAVIPIDKPIFFLSLLFFVPTFAMLFADYSSYFLDQFDEMDIQQKMAHYGEVEAEVGVVSFWGIIRVFLVYAAFFLPIIINTRSIMINRKRIDICILKLFRIMTAVLLFAAMFLFLGFDNFVFSYRYLFMSFIPLTIITVYLYNKHYIRRWMYKSIIIMGICSNAFHYLFGLYKCL